MKENESFSYFGEFQDFDSLLLLVNKFEEDDWLAYKERKKTGGIASAYSDTIPLIYNPKIRNAKPVHHIHYERFQRHVDAVIQAALPFIGGTKAVQAMLTRMKPQSTIARHKDRGEVTKASHRIHVPIITNQQCIFTIENDEKHLQAGSVWLIDNTDRFHSVRNDGNEHRIHLIVDAQEI
jgi:quercetin dioxygenase-like cupin family protein